MAISYVANNLMTITWHILTHKKLYNERKGNLYKKNLKRMETDTIPACCLKYDVEFAI